MSAGELVPARWIASLAHASHRNDGIRFLEEGLTAATIVSLMSCDRLDQRTNGLRGICNQSVGGAGALKCNAVQHVIATVRMWSPHWRGERGLLASNSVRTGIRGVGH